MFRTNVYKLNIQAIDSSHKLWQGIQFSFRFSPVVLLTPISNEFPEFFQFHTLTLVTYRFLVRPSRSQDTLTKIFYCRLRNMDRKRTNIS
ncbi:hypothetical protein D3C85_1452550 [compost metagenome]